MTVLVALIMLMMKSHDCAPPHEQAGKGNLGRVCAVREFGEPDSEHLYKSKPHRKKAREV